MKTNLYYDNILEVINLTEKVNKVCDGITVTYDYISSVDFDEIEKLNIIHAEVIFTNFIDTDRLQKKYLLIYTENKKIKFSIDYEYFNAYRDGGYCQKRNITKGYGKFLKKVYQLLESKGFCLKSQPEESNCILNESLNKKVEISFDSEFEKIEFSKFKTQFKKTIKLLSNGVLFLNHCYNEGSSVNTINLIRFNQEIEKPMKKEILKYSDVFGSFIRLEFCESLQAYDSVYADVRINNVIGRYIAKELAQEDGGYLAYEGKLFSLEELLYGAFKDEFFNKKNIKKWY